MVRTEPLVREVCVDPAPGTFDEQAWRGFRQRLQSYVGRRADAAEVDDIVGEILLKLVRSQDALLSARNPTAWIMRVAANALADHHRRRAAELGRQAAVAVDYPLLAAPQDRADEDAAAELARCLLPFIRRLPENCAATVMLTEIDGLTGREAAERLGVPVSTVKSRVRRGRARLKAMLSRCCDLEIDRRSGIVRYQRRKGACARDC